MKKIVTKNGQQFYVYESRKEASKDLAVIVEGMKCVFVEGAEMDDSLYIKYKDGRTYSFNKFEEKGRFRKTNFDVVVFSNDSISVAYGKVVLRNIDDYDELYSPEKDSEEKNWYFDEKESETTETETATDPETTEETTETATEIESAKETVKKTESAVNMVKYAIPKTKFLPTEIFDTKEECDYWFKFHKFPVSLNRAFILKDTLTKRTSLGLKKFRRYTAEMTLKNIDLESGLIYLMNEIKNHGFELNEPDFFGCKSFIDCYVSSGDRSILFIENNESGTYIEYQYHYES